ncbi:MAG: Slp family lipoprotein [Methylosarcina sp.]
MKRYLFISTWVLLSACSTLPPAIKNAPLVDVSYQQASTSINSYKNVPIRWGGVIIDLQNEQTYSLLQVLSYPLDSNGRPSTDKSYQGRFLIKTSEFLDPAVYVEGKEITAAGVLKGDSEQQIGNKTLRLPMIESTVLHLWPEYTTNRYYYGGYGYYPYYWGDYGYSPCYWGGFYRPFPPY